MSAETRLQMRDLAEPNSIRCPCCCSTTFATSEKLREHLKDVQEKLENLQCYACSTRMDNLHDYTDHLTSCHDVLSARKHVIECSNLKPPEGLKFSPVKAPTSGLKITRIADKISLEDASLAKAYKIVTPTAITPMVVIEKNGKRKMVQTLTTGLFSGKRSSDVIKGKRQKLDETVVPIPSDKLADDSFQDVDNDDVFDFDASSAETRPNAEKALADSTALTSPKVVEKCSVAQKNILYKCKICKFTTKNKELQKSHKCSKSGQFSCPYCDKIFTSKNNSDLHVKQHVVDMLEEELTRKISCADPLGDSEACRLCNEVISLSLVDIHLRIHKEGVEIRYCCRCRGNFLSETSFKEHLKSCKPESSAVDEFDLDSTLGNHVKCEHCYAIFDTQENATKHMDTKHFQEVDCKECKDGFNTEEALDRHMQSKHKVKFDLKGPNRRAKFDCAFCEEKKLTLAAINKHFIKEHIDVEKKLNEHCDVAGICSSYCNVCKEPISDVPLHFKLHKSGFKVHKCLNCPQKFISQERLNKHLKNIHEVVPDVQQAFTCPDCPMSYNNKRSLVLHAVASTHAPQLLDGKTVFYCKYCSKGHLRKRDLWKHEKLHVKKGDKPNTDEHQTLFHYADPSSTIYECNVCNKKFKTKNSAEVHAVAKDHMKGYEYIEPLTCNFCQKKFARKAELIRHVMKHTAKKVEKQKEECEICGKVCTSTQGLQKHMAKHSQFVCVHCHHIYGDEQELLAHVSKEHSGLPDLIKCHFCVRYFADIDALRAHSQTLDHIESKLNETFPTSLDLYFCDPCQEYVNVDLQDLHDNIHKRGVSKFFRCSACSKRFCSVINLAIHIKGNHKNVLDSITYQCPMCPTIVNTAKSLSSHYQKHVTSSDTLKTLKCSFCNKTFRRAGDRHKHELIHKGTKDHHCKLCPKSFRLAQMLTLHMRTHTNERPYKCPECEMSFKSNSNMNNHIRSKHRVDRTYQCPYCPKAFKTRAALVGHIGAHEMLFKCDDCGRNFPTRHAATNHIKKIHLVKNREIFECVICNATYGRSLFLAKHMKTHTKLDGKDDLVQKLLEASNVAHYKETSSPRRSGKGKSSK